MDVVSVNATLPSPNNDQGVSFDPNTMINVAAFGALGNGTDSTASIEQAEQAALTSGKDLFFGAGTYDVTSTLYLSSGETWIADPGSVTIQAASGLSTLLALDGSPASSTLSAPVSISNVSLSGFVFVGDTPAVTNPSPFVISWIASNLRFTDDQFEDIAGIGMLLSNTANTTIQGCSFTNIGNGTATATNPCNTASQGIAFTDSSTLTSQDNVVSNCTFSAIGLDAISATQQANFVASGNEMTDLNVLPGYSLCPAGAAGIYVYQDTNVLVASNSIEGASGNGIDALDDQNLKIMQNTVDNSYEAGVAVCDSSNAMLYGNLSTNNNALLDHFPQTAGITIVADPNSSSYMTTLIDNTATNTGSATSQDWGLQIDSAASTMQITIGGGNSFSGNRLGATNADITQQSTELTTGADTVALNGPNAVIVATANALSLQDEITDSSAATLVLQGSGIFDLRAPLTMTNVVSLVAQEGNWSSTTAAGQLQLVYLRNGLSLNVDVLPAAGAAANAGIVIFGANDSSVIDLSTGTDYVYLGSATETALGGGGADTFIIDTVTAGATIDGGTGASTLRVRGGGTVTMGASITRIATVTLTATAGAAATSAAYTFTANTIADLAIIGSGAADSITVGDASQSVDANGGAVHIIATAADAGIKVRGTTGAELEVTTGGTVTLNPSTTNILVRLDVAANLRLNRMSFISAIGQVAGNTITANASGQTIGGVAGNDTLIGYSGFGDTFAGTAAGLNGDILKGFGGNDAIDLTDISYGSDGPALAYAGSATQGTLSLSDGSQMASLTLFGNFSVTNFQTASDGHDGTLVYCR